MNIDLIKNIFSRREKDAFKISLNPWRDWFIVIAFFVAGLILVIVYMATFFLKVNDDNAIFVIEKQEQSTETINRRTMLNILNEYQQKEDRFEELKNNKPKFIDPS